MFRLLAEHFRGVTQGRFDHDLDNKSAAVLLHDDAGRLKGFTTLDVRDFSFEGQDVIAVYSGDTIVARESWGSDALPRAWLSSVKRLHELHPAGELWWLLLSSGFRTYRFLPVFWREFYPCPGESTPRHLQRLTDLLASARYGDEYDAASGIVRFERPQVLVEGISTITGRRRRNPHVAYFEQRNPGHDNGDELVCLAELSPENQTRIGKRMLSLEVRTLAVGA